MTSPASIRGTTERPIDRYVIAVLDVSSTSLAIYAVAVLGQVFGGPGPSSFGRQPRLSEITIVLISGASPKI